VIAPSHAGGVVVRSGPGAARFLLVSARTQPDVWVLPKGHIEPGESAEQTAAREVLEEAGVVATVESKLGLIEFDNPRGHVRAEFFLMRYAGEGATIEQRRTAWMSRDEAIAALGFEDMRRLVQRAHSLVSGDSRQ
jgi:8-oxo-dGTP pyrophosphatase MutT (NUDIX family)